MESSADLTLKEGVSNSDESRACVAALRVEVLHLQQIVSELLLKNQCLRQALEDVETMRAEQLNKQPRVNERLSLDEVGVAHTISKAGVVCQASCVGQSSSAGEN
jgi:hypothetical protein